MLNPLTTELARARQADRRRATEANPLFPDLAPHAARRARLRARRRQATE